MKTENETTADPDVHTQNIQRQLEELIQHVRTDIRRVTEPRFQALLSATADVLTGLKAAYQRYETRG
jgi:hypothetical protein